MGSGKILSIRNSVVDPYTVQILSSVGEQCAVDFMESNFSNFVFQAARVVQAQRLLAEGQAKTKYHFVAQNPMEMSLRKGEIVVLLRKVDANW